ncbi:MAG: hypothetical protein KUG79_16895 [Pseudomonadales bacterium]|nr:hypothetical protein [Pseudomonadales bacterium]
MMNEADTREHLNDPKLVASGSSNVKNSYIRREFICPGQNITGSKRTNPVLYDYVLIYKPDYVSVKPRDITASPFAM